MPGPELRPLVTPDFAHANLVAQLLQEVQREEKQSQESNTRPPSYEVQKEILARCLADLGYETDGGAFLQETMMAPAFANMTRQQLLIEYTTMQLARQFALREELMYDNGEETPAGKLTFFVHDAGLEVPFSLLFRHCTSEDPKSPYYRGTTTYLYWGGTVQDLAAQDFHTGGALSGRQLGGHVSLPEASILPVTSETGSDIYHAVGIQKELEIRRARGDTDGNERFNRADAVTIFMTGEATLGQDQVLNGIVQAVHDQLPVVFVIVNNNGGISMGLSTSSVNGDPLAPVRGLENNGLCIVEVEGDNIEALAEANNDAMAYARERRMPVVLHLKEIPRITDHTSSSQEKRYTTGQEYNRRMQRDPLAAYERYLVSQGAATPEVLERIQILARDHVVGAIESATTLQPEDPQNLYHHLYPPSDHFRSEFVDAVRIEEHQKKTPREAVPPVYEPPRDFSTLEYLEPVPSGHRKDRLRSTRRDGVEYIDCDTLREGPLLTYGQMVNIVIAQEMKRDKELFMIGEDVGMYDRAVWNNMNAYFEAKLKDAATSGKYTIDHLELARSVLELVKAHRGYEADPFAIACFCSVMEGKGGVFGTSRFLETLFGPYQCSHFRITEAGIVGTAFGRALTKGNGPWSRGATAIAEIQFDPYLWPAMDQIQLLAHERWRALGQFNGGIILKVQGGNRVGAATTDDAGGVGGIGHGTAQISQLRIDGWRVVAPGDAIEAQGLWREAIDYARGGGRVALFDPINLYNNGNERAPYQGPDARLPLGEARIHRWVPESVLPRTSAIPEVVVVTHGNNVRITRDAAEILAADRIRLTTLNTRGGMGVEFDYERAVEAIAPSSGKVIVFEAGPGLDAARYTADLNTLQPLLDAPIEMLHARNIPMPAGARSEAYTVPQKKDLVAAVHRILRI